MRCAAGRQDEANFLSSHRLESLKVQSCFQLQLMILIHTTLQHGDSAMNVEMKCGHVVSFTFDEGSARTKAGLPNCLWSTNDQLA